MRNASLQGHLWHTYKVSQWLSRNFDLYAGNASDVNEWALIPSYFLKMGRSRPLFVYFRPFLFTISIKQIEKGIDGLLGIRTCSRRMLGTVKTILSVFFHICIALNESHNRNRASWYTLDLGPFALSSLFFFFGITDCSINNIKSFEEEFGASYVGNTF